MLCPSVLNLGGPLDAYTRLSSYPRYCFPFLLQIPWKKNGTKNIVVTEVNFPSLRTLSPTPQNPRSASKLSGTLWMQGGKRRESLQLHLWNLNSTSNSPVAPRQLSCQISANQHEAETSANLNKHCKTCAKGNDVITYVISANQHFASIFLMQIFSSSDVVASSPFFSHPCLQSAPGSLLAGCKILCLPQVIFRADLHLFQTSFVIRQEDNRDGDITMPLFPETIGSAGYSDQ